MKNKIIFFLLINVAILVSGVFPGVKGFDDAQILSEDIISEQEATSIAELWYAMELNSTSLKMEQSTREEKLNNLKNHTVHYLISEYELLNEYPEGTLVLAYVFTYEPSGYVIISGSRKIDPVIAFDVKSTFSWEENSANFLRNNLGKGMLELWEGSVQLQNVHPNWTSLKAQLNSQPDLRESTFDLKAGTLNILLDTAAWNQSGPYNDTAVANNGSNEVPTGCVATAMGIKLRYHEWPTTGNSSYSYSDTWGSIKYSHSVTFSSETYTWANMPITNITTANADIADLLYHTGVSVGSDYEAGGTSAWPQGSSVASNAFNNFFRYKGGYNNTSGHDAPIIKSIRAELPVAVGTLSHALVADGYRDTQSPYFHINAGWGGSSDGWYNLTAVPTGALVDSIPYSSPNNYMYVEGDWSGSENGNLQTPYNTVLEGVNAVPTNGHVWIKGGNYTGAGNEPITITKAMTIHSYYQSPAVIQ